MKKKQKKEKENKEQFIKLFQEGISLIKIWIIIKKQEYEKNECFNELQKVLFEIEHDKDYSQYAFEDIQYLLRSFEYLPLKIKRIFNMCLLVYL